MLKMKNECDASDSGRNYGAANKLRLPLNIPDDPRRKCRGCGCQDSSKEPRDKPAPKPIKRSTWKEKSFSKPPPHPVVVPRKKSSESGMGFLQSANSSNDPNCRFIRYREASGIGSPNLIQKTPMHGRKVRDSDAETIQHQPRKLTKPDFLDELDPEEIAGKTGHGFGSCPPPFKKNMFNNQILTSRRITAGLRFLKRTNTPHQRPPTPMDDPPKEEVGDTCWKKTRNPKAKSRETCKRLCEAPSMTNALDSLFTDYIQKCSNTEDSDACRIIHHAPSFLTREPRRSILKENISEELTTPARKSRNNSHVVRFDKKIAIISTITKIQGLDASLKQTGRIKLLQQMRHGKPVETGLEERYPLHAKDPKKKAARNSDLGRISDDEDLEEKRAKQDMARIYFTTEAAKLIACANLGALSTNPLKKEVVKRHPLPHFFLDRLGNDLEKEQKRKQNEKISKVKSEMDAFDTHIWARDESHPNPHAPFNFFQHSEKSMNDVKLKVEIMKRQRERDVQAAAERNRCRKSFFRQMLPSFTDVIQSDLLEYSLKRASRLSEEERALAGVSYEVVNERKIFEEHQRFTQHDLINTETQNTMKVQKHNEQMQKLQHIVQKLATQDRNRYTYETLMRRQETNAEMNEQLVTDLLEVVVDVVAKISHYRSATGQNPPERLYQEWKAAGFAALNDEDEMDPDNLAPKPPRTAQHMAAGATGATELLNELRINDYLTCTGDWSLENGFSESFQTPDNETLRTFVQCIMETLFPNPKIKARYPKLKTAGIFALCGIDYKWEAERIKYLSEMLVTDYKFEIIDVDAAIKEALVAFSTSIKPFEMKYPKNMVHPIWKKMKWANDLHPAVALQLDRLDGMKPDHPCFREKLHLLDGLKTSDDFTGKPVTGNNLKRMLRKMEATNDKERTEEPRESFATSDGDQDPSTQMMPLSPILKRVSDQLERKPSENRVRFKALPKADGSVLPTWLLANRPQVFIAANKHRKLRVVVRKPKEFYRSETLTVVKAQLNKHDPAPIAGRIPKCKINVKHSSKTQREINMGRTILQSLYNGKGISDELIAQIIVEKLRKCPPNSVALILNYPHALCQALVLETAVKRLSIDVPPCYHHDDSVIEQYRKLWNTVSEVNLPLKSTNNLGLGADHDVWRRNVEQGKRINSRLLAPRRRANLRDNDIRTPEDLLRAIEKEMAPNDEEEKGDLGDNLLLDELNEDKNEEINFTSFIDAIVIADTDMREKFAAESSFHHAHRVAKMASPQSSTNRHELLLRFAFLQMKKFYEKKNLAEVVPKGSNDALYYGTMVEVIQEILKLKEEKKEELRIQHELEANKGYTAEMQTSSEGEVEEEEEDIESVEDPFPTIFMDEEEDVEQTENEIEMKSSFNTGENRGSKHITSPLNGNDLQGSAEDLPEEHHLGDYLSEDTKAKGHLANGKLKLKKHNKKGKSKMEVQDDVKSTLEIKHDSKEKVMDGFPEDEDEMEVDYDKDGNRKTRHRSSDEVRDFYGEDKNGEVHDEPSQFQRDEEHEKLTEKELLLRFLKDVSKETLESIANIWINMEANFTRIIRSVLSNIRFHHDTIAQYAADLRAKFTDILERIDERQALVSTFQDEFNSIDQEIRADSDVKTELHARVDELVKKLEIISTDKYDFSKEEIFRLLNDGYLQREVKVQVNLFIALLQAETERYIETVMFINEFFKAFQSCLPDRDTNDDMAEFNLEELQHLRHHFDWDIDTDGSKASTYDSEISLPDNPITHSTPYIRMESKDFDEFDKARLPSASSQGQVGGEFKLPLEIPQEEQPPLKGPEDSEYWDPEINRFIIGKDEEFEGEGDEEVEQEGSNEDLLNVEGEGQEEEEGDYGAGVDGRKEGVLEPKKSVSAYSFDVEPNPNDPREYDIFDPIEYFDDESIFFEPDEFFDDEVRPGDVPLTPSEDNTDNQSVNTEEDDDDQTLYGDESSAHVLTSESSDMGPQRGKQSSLPKQGEQPENYRQQDNNNERVVVGKKSVNDAATVGGGRKRSILSNDSKRKDNNKDKGKREVVVTVTPTEGVLEKGDDANNPTGSDGPENTLALPKTDGGRPSSVQKPKELAILKKQDSKKSAAKSDVGIIGLAVDPSTPPLPPPATAPPDPSRYPPIPEAIVKKRKKLRKPDDFSSSTEDELEKHWKEMHSLQKSRAKRAKSVVSQAENIANRITTAAKRDPSGVATDSKSASKLQDDPLLVDTLECQSCSKTSLNIGDELYQGVYGKTIRDPPATPVPNEEVVAPAAENGEEKKPENGDESQGVVAAEGDAAVTPTSPTPKPVEEIPCSQKVVKHQVRNHVSFMHPNTLGGSIAPSIGGGEAGAGPPNRRTFYPSYTDGMQISDENSPHHFHHHHMHRHHPFHHHEFERSDRPDTTRGTVDSDPMMDDVLFDENGSATEDSEFIDMIDVTYVTADAGRNTRRTFLDQIVDNQVEAFYFFDAIADHSKAHVRKIEHVVINAIRLKYPDEPPPPAIVLIPESARKEYYKKLLASKRKQSEVRQTSPESKDSPQVATTGTTAPTPTMTVQQTDDTSNHTVPTSAVLPQQPPNTPVEPTQQSSSGETKQVNIRKSSVRSDARKVKGNKSDPQDAVGDNDSVKLAKKSTGEKDSGPVPMKNISNPDERMGDSGGVTDVKTKETKDQGTTVPETTFEEPKPHHPRPLTPRELALKEFMFPQGIVAYPSDPIINEMAARASLKGKLRQRVQMWQRAFQYESVRVKYQLSLVECKALRQLGQFKSIISQVLQDAKVQASNFYVDEVKRANQVANIFRFAVENETGVQAKIIIEKDQLYLDQETEGAC